MTLSKVKQFLIFSFFLLMFLSCAQQKADITFKAMNTVMQIRAYGRNSEQSLLEVKNEIQRLENLLSVTNTKIDATIATDTQTSIAKTSIASKTPVSSKSASIGDVFRVNHADGQTTKVSEETFYLAQFALDFATKTDGAFNPALYPITSQWGFTTGDYRIPSQEETEALLKLTDFTKVKLFPQTCEIQLENGMMLDFGATGKGFAADKAVEILKKNGIKSALMDLGGNIQLIGTKPDGNPWKIGIKNPWEGEAVCGLSLSDCAVVTSGGYERFFTGSDGKKYIHIFDAKTGRPVENEAASVTIISSSGLYADALSTSLFVMGIEKAQEFWRKYQDFEFIFITKDKQLFYSEGISSIISLNYDFSETVVIHK